MIYNLLKEKKPKSVVLKMRQNNDMLVVNSKELEIFYLNGTSAFFLEKCDGDRSIEQIKNLMLDEFDVPESLLCKDLVVLVRDLQWKKLIALED